MGQKRYKLAHYEDGPALRYIQFETAAKLVAQGKADPVFHGDGSPKCFLMSASAKPLTKLVPVLTNCIAAITPHEMDLIAFQNFRSVDKRGKICMVGRSRTLGLSEYQRMERVKRGQPAEDQVELALAKLEGFRAARMSA